MKLLQPFVRSILKAGLAVALPLVAVTARGDGFLSTRPTSSNRLVIGGKTFRASETDRSLTGTGWEGTVVDMGTHWMVVVTGGTLVGRVWSDSGVEIILSPTASIAIENGSTSSANSAISGGGGVGIVGPGYLHIDQICNQNAIYSNAGSISIGAGASVSINQLGDGNAIRCFKDFTLLGSALHVNALGDAAAVFVDGADVTIVGSVTTLCAKKPALVCQGGGAITVEGSSFHAFSATDIAVRLGQTSQVSRGGDVTIRSSVFCARGQEAALKTYTSTALSVENAIGAIVGNGCGITGFGSFFVDGGATKLTVVGNLDAEKGMSSGHYVSSGQAVYLSPVTRSEFEIDAGRVTLFAPGHYGLVCGTNWVCGGRLEVSSSPRYGDLQSLFTAVGIVETMHTLVGESVFEGEFWFTDALLAQILESFWTGSEMLFRTDGSKAHTGIRARAVCSLAGEMSVEAADTGVYLGAGTIPGDALFYMEGGRVGIDAGRLGIVDWNANGGSTTLREDDSRVWMSGGRLSAKGGLDGILTCGGLLMDGGTLEAAATGGFAAGSSDAKPYLQGYALSANNGFAIDGGSFVATAGAVRTAPNTSSEHDFAAVHPCDLDVSGAPAGSPVAVSDVVPAWYGTNDLYPLGGLVRLWLPAGRASLRYDGVAYVANGDGTVVSGDNAFLPGRTLLSISVEGPAAVSSGGTASYVCRASYDDGTVVSIRPSWTVVSGGAFASVTSAGVLSAAEVETTQTAVLRASFGGKAAERTVTIRAGGLPDDGDWYVDAANGSDANDGRSWETAKATIQAAIDAAEAGDLVYVNDGTYGPVRTDGKELEIVSVNGAEATAIDAAGNGRCATLTDVARPAIDDPIDTATVLRGFTLRNGSSAEDGGGAVGGLLEDCVLRDNRTETAGGGAAGARLVRCVVRDNAAPNGPGGGTMVCDLSDCLVWNNSALQGGGLWGWGHSAVNCTVVGNAATLQGGGMMSAVFATNCIVWGNSAPEYPDLYGCDEWHLCSSVVDPGCGSVTDDPFFVDPANGDFRLRAGSPCIDAGAGVRAAGETDLAGESRVLGDAVDIGAFERVPLPPAVSVHRFYSKRYRGHFFTINEGEKDDLIAHNPNWKYEGVAYRAFREQAPGTTALYRFYSKNYRGHFFTINEGEKNNLRAHNPNWKFEGIAYYVYPRQAEGTVPVYRFWSANYRHHFYTTNEGEKDNLRANNPNWKFEGIAFWALEKEAAVADAGRAMRDAERAMPDGGPGDGIPGGGASMRGAEWMLRAMGADGPAAIAVPGVTNLGDVLVETRRDIPDVSALAAFFDEGAVPASAFRLSLPDGEWAVTLWSAADDPLVNEDAECAFDFDVPADGAWHWLRVSDPDADEDAFSLWIRAE